MPVKRTKSQYARLIELDRKIRGGGHPNCLTFAKDWGVSSKTVQRDIDFLRDQCGAPIAYDRDRNGFHYADKSWWLPSVALSEGELLAVLLAARVAEQYRGSPVAKQIERVFDKLTDLLPEKISINPTLLFSRFTFTSPPAKPVDEAIWTTVVRGLLSQQTLRVVYRPFEAAALMAGKESRINPYHIANLQGDWYVFGVHAGHTDVRQFAMARIERATLTSESFVPPPDFDPEKILADTFGRFAGVNASHTVQLLYSKDLASWVEEREWHPQQIIHRRRTGEIELSFPAKGLFEVQRWVLSWGHDVKVLAPKELQRAVRAEIRLMAKAVG